MSRTGSEYRDRQSSKGAREYIRQLRAKLERERYRFAFDTVYRPGTPWAEVEAVATRFKRS